jgi:hypothetical protein
MQTRLAPSLILFLGAALTVRAHVGSPDIFYEGNAGPYHLFVTVRMPQVIPGVAEIRVRSESMDIRAVQIVPLRLTGPGSNLPPIPDFAQPSKEDPQFFTGNLWLMESGALQVRITADGAKGKGELSVPVPAFAQRTLPMQKSLKAILIFPLLFLAIGLIFIAGAAVREGNLEPGEKPEPQKIRRARMIMVITAVVVAGILYLGRAWWGAEASNYQRDINFFKPPIAETTLENGNRLVIRARGQDEKWPEFVKMEEVIPDHNHLMHLFLIRVPGMDRMWHLHPERIAGGAFAEDLPTMSAGRYQVFADIVDKDGFPWTLVGRTDLPEVKGKPLAGDDSSWSGAPLTRPAEESSFSLLPDGGRMIWQLAHGPLKANVPMNFKFNVQAKDGKPAQDIEPYMGMAGHAEFVRSDFNVFAHIHPAGSVSMAALELAQAGLGGGSAALQAAMPGGMTMKSEPLSHEVSFPYGFPQPGDFRIFVQIKRGGQVETGVFDAHVQ